ncbi:MAG: 4-hydroxy-tetrahydrodipicolinate reductase, partial [Opitutaceae bacterium]
MPLALLLHGAQGRMGRAIAAAAPEMGARIAAAFDADGDPAARIGECEVIVDFSSPAATAGLLELAALHHKPIVIGTTGHEPRAKAELLATAARVPCVWTGNFSVGVNLLFALTRRAARVLGPEYDAEIVEMHHRLKKDAPSGTAARLLEVIREERRLGAEAARHGRRGITGERSSAEIGVHSIRGGDVVGDHTVMF